MEIEIRGDRVTLEGYVNAVERDSRLLSKNMCRGAKGPFVEKVAAGTFQRALEKNGNVELRFNHERTLGNQKDGVLELQEDAIGLKAKAQVTDQEVIDCARRGELRGWSFGFRAKGEEWEEDQEKGCERRTLTDIDIDEVSILTKCPAYVATTVELRGDEETIRERRAAESGEVTIIEADEEKRNYREELELLKLRRK